MGLPDGRTPGLDEIEQPEVMKNDRGETPSVLHCDDEWHRIGVVAYVEDVSWSKPWSVPRYFVQPSRGLPRLDDARVTGSTRAYLATEIRDGVSCEGKVTRDKAQG